VKPLLVYENEIVLKCYEIKLHSTIIKKYYSIPMSIEKREHPEIKSKLHPLNKHRERYNFKELIACSPKLAAHVKLNKFDDESINFSDPNAVKELNSALLKYFYGIEYWDIPKNYLCPPIPGRADYIHYMADLLSFSGDGKSQNNEMLTCLDVGVGANCVYPIIGVKEYNWTFIGSDIDPVSIGSAQKIVDENTILKEKVDLRLQANPDHIFTRVLKKDEKIDLTISNPPFHSSEEEVQEGTLRKQRNLRQIKVKKSVQNFGGANKELWCKGGEAGFIKNMILESKEYAESCKWFSSLVSKESNLNEIYLTLEKIGAKSVKTIKMGQGNKKSRIVAWSFQC